MSYSVAEIKELMSAFAGKRLTSLTIKDGDFTVTMEAVAAAGPAQAHAAQPVLTIVEHEAEKPMSGSVVTSPIVGTFYAAATPDSAPYVKVGDSVKKGDVLFIIESMKLMNEVTSELDGTVAAILVGDGQGVEFGQPILTIE